MFLLGKSIEIDKSLISSALREFEWGSKSKSKFTCKNTGTSRTLVKSHKNLQNDSTEAVIEKSWSEKFHKKITQKKLLWSPFFSYLTTCNFTEKEPHHSYFPMIFERFFRILLCGRTLVNEQKYSPEYVLEQSWSEEFHKIYSKETVAACNFIEKGLHHSYVT